MLRLMSTDQSSRIAAPDWRRYAALALAEDRASHDITTELLEARRHQSATGVFRAEGDFVMAGLPLVAAVFGELESSTAVVPLVEEGDGVRGGMGLAEVRGPAGTLLAGERVALNYLTRLCGVATVTRRATEAVAGTGSVITDTRKTTPGLRDLEKYAVRIGGGVNHRATLADAILWKDNHWALLASTGGDLAAALRGAPDDVPICVEVETGAQLDAALAAGVQWILADNQTPETIREWASRLGAGVTLEASGGIKPETAGAYARAGAHRISIGSLTYSPDPVSISFEIEGGNSTTV